MATFNITVSMGKDNYQLTMNDTATGQSLMEELEKITGVMVRKQKLIFKGKVVDSKTPLKAAKIQSGSKLMLLATAGVGPTQKAPPNKATTAPSLLQSAKAPTTQSLLKKPAQPNAQPLPSGAMQDRAKVWQKTGFVAVRDMGLQALPDNIGGIAEAVRVLDATNNCLTAVPAVLASLKNVQSLRLSHNQIATMDSDMESVAAGFASLSHLTTLVLDCNRLESLEGCLQPSLSKLAVLSVSSNALSTLPGSLSVLQKLRLLNLSSNQLTALPDCLGSLTSLVELDASSNTLAVLPDSTSCLKSLRTLQLDNNRLKSIPPGMLSGCESLVTLTIHNNPMSLEDLRNTEGFAEYDRRRVAKCDKQMEMSVMLDVERSFNEGADVPVWEHFSKFNK